MHIIYLDESGTHAEARHFVVAGLSLFERQTFHVAEDMNRLQLQCFPDETEPVEFHAALLRAPDEHVRSPFDKLARTARLELLDAIYDLLVRNEPRLFAVVMEKDYITRQGDDPYGVGFEQIVNRFDLMLSRVNRERDERNRGLVVMAESSYRENLETLARRIWAQGHRWGQMHNIADIPYLAPARNTRLLQLADFVTNAVYGRYESGNTRNFDKIARLFDQEDGRFHGLLHLCARSWECYCPACVTRRLSAPREDPVA
ncbi:MAG: DUF3800 domain-containing protein [Dehalococcoidia bacterium]